MTGEALDAALGALTTEARRIEEMVADLPAERWATATPAPGWTVAHQMAHLTFMLGLAGLTVEEPGAFRERCDCARSRGGLDAVVKMQAEDDGADEPRRLQERWAETLDKTVARLAAARPDQLVPWVHDSLRPVELAAALTIELLAHGQDVADALGVCPVRGDELYHPVAFVARTWRVGYAVHGLEPPPAGMGFRVVAPSGVRWVFGDGPPADVVHAGAEDFCLLASHRRDRDDLAIETEGGWADEWLDIAQAYPGPPGAGRAPARTGPRVRARPRPAGRPA